jgi:glutamate 5-kinase
LNRQTFRKTPLSAKAVRKWNHAINTLAILDEGGHDIVCGLINYNATEARCIAQHASREIEGILGYVNESELIHRDNLVLL